MKMKLEIADLYSAAIDIGGAMLVDKLHIALGVIEWILLILNKFVISLDI